MQNNMFDLHVHTNNSDGGNDKVAFLCETAVEKGFRAIAFTDHCNIDTYVQDNCSRCVRHAYFDMAKAKQMFFGPILVLSGIEISQALCDTALTAHILEKQEYDIVLTSVHSVHGEEDFKNCASYDDKKKRELLTSYFDILTDTVNKTDFDVLAHILYPFRYIKCDFSEYKEKIKNVLDALAAKEKALEINTRDLMGSEKLRNFYLDILCEFRKSGGKYVTVGSEAYYNEDIGYGIDIGTATAKRAGFPEITLYEKRIPYLFPV